MDVIDGLRWLLALLFGAIALKPRVALRILLRGQSFEDPEDFLVALRLIGYVGLIVVIVSWIVDDLQAS